jgi:hypothetical protein
MDEEKIAEVKLYRNGKEVQFYNEGDVAKALIEVGGEIYQYSIHEADKDGKRTNRSIEQSL